MITQERHGAVARIALNRPDQLNSLDAATVAELDQAFSALSDDRGVRVVVITGEGKAFSAGADIKEFRELAGPDQFKAFIRALEQAIRKLDMLPQPTIAAINGVAFGGGLELAMACDLRIADAVAKLGLPEIKLGLLPGAGGTQRLPRLVPPTVAMQMIMTGDPIDAVEAHRIGLVNDYVPEGGSVDRAMELAEKLAGLAPLALAAAKRLLDRGPDLAFDDALEFERETVAMLFGTADRVEGTAAFVEKRAPDFRGV